MVWRVPTPASCTCLICHPDPQYAESPTVKAVTEHGWSTLWIAGPLDFAYTVGVYHTFGQPELVMFGLQGQDMSAWLNAAVELGRDQGWPDPETPFAGVIEGFETQVRDVHPSWYRALFGTALGFYRGVAVPFRQLVWPARNGRWPWDDDATRSSRNRQAFAWLPLAQHPEGAWRLVGEMGHNFPFPVGPDAWALTTRSVLDGSRPVTTVAYDQGGYDVLDERGYDADDLCLAFLGDLVHRHDELKEFCDLKDGQMATASIGDDGRTIAGWTRAYLKAPDRRASRRAWTIAEPA